MTLQSRGFILQMAQGICSNFTDDVIADLLHLTNDVIAKLLQFTDDDVTAE